MEKMLTVTPQEFSSFHKGGRAANFDAQDPQHEAYYFAEVRHRFIEFDKLMLFV
jgi:hypothetical protein